MIRDIVMLLIGIAVGILAIWFGLRGTVQAAVEKATATGDAERASLTATLQARDSQATELRASLVNAEGDREHLRGQLVSESNKRAAAEEKNNHIPILENIINTKEGQIERLQGEAKDLTAMQSELKTTIEKERKASLEQLAIVNDAQEKLSDAFKALSVDALKNNSQSFLELANLALEKFHQGAQSDLTARQKAIDELVKPLKESLEKVDGKISAIEKERTVAYTGLTEQVKAMATTQVQLQTETANLVKALRTPQVRGRWGEIQLKRVVEMAGMVDHCDFNQQQTVTTDDGTLRPDLIVRLPGGKNVVIDAKCPLAAYLDALSSPDESTRVTNLKKHAKQVSDHIKKLSAKGYWAQFTPAPEFVVLFLPGETFFSAALEQDPELIEAGAEQKVILATPTTLIALLRAVAYGWKQELIAQNTKEISDLGCEIYDRLSVLAGFFAGIGAHLNGAVVEYNKGVASVESRLLVTARKFRDLGAVTDKEIENIKPVEAAVRSIQATEFNASPSANRLEDPQEYVQTLIPAQKA